MAMPATTNVATAPFDTVAVSSGGDAPSAS